LPPAANNTLPRTSACRQPNPLLTAKTTHLSPPPPVAKYHCLFLTKKLPLAADEIISHPRLIKSTAARCHQWNPPLPGADNNPPLLTEYQDTLPCFGFASYCSKR